MTPVMERDQHRRKRQRTSFSEINDFAKQCSKPKFGPAFLEFGLHWERDTALAVEKGHYLLRLQV
jgi:hypothetical protein